MNRSKPFLYSLALHLLLIGLMGWVYSALRTPPPKETKIAVSMLTYAPANVPSTPTPEPFIPPEPVSQMPKPVKPVKPVPKSVAPAPSKPSAVIPIPSAQSASAASAPLLAAVSPKPVPQTEPQVAKAPPPPPPVNHQKAYEDDNLGRIRALLAQNLTYPKNARRLNQQGDVTVMFSLSPSGEVGTVAITKSSGFELLDEAARRLIETTAPQFPKPSKTVQISVPIGYKLR